MRESTEETTESAAGALSKEWGVNSVARSAASFKTGAGSVSDRSFSPLSLAALIAIFSWTSLAHVLAIEDDAKSKITAPNSTDSAAKQIKKSAWSYPTYLEARKSLTLALEEMKLPPAAIQVALRPWPESEIGPQPALWLDALAESFRAASPELAEIVDQSLAQRKSLTIPTFESVEAESLPTFVKNHLRLLAGRWLAQHGYYDESLEMLEGLEANALIDPATLLFSTAAAHHQLLQKDECLTAVAKLLENEAAIPGRYRSLAHLMQADLQPLEADSLDETSRLMESVERRLGHARAGKRVRDEEDAVVAKLDKLIEELEKQREEQQKQQQTGGASSQPPSKPMQDSQAAGGKGPGNVDPKKLSSLGAWGNIPPKQRQEALQQLGRDLPAHYREVVEEYFRKLASEEKAPK